MLTIVYNGHKITGEVKDIYEFIKLAESDVVSEKNDEKISDTFVKLGYEIETDEPNILKAKKQSYDFDYNTYFVVDFNKNEVQKYASNSKIITNDVSLSAEEINLLDELFGKNHWTKIEHDSDEIHLGANDERWSTYYTTEPIEKMDEETAEKLKGETAEKLKGIKMFNSECGDCVEAFRYGVPCPDKDGYCPYKKQNCVEKGMKDFYQGLSWEERYLVWDIKNLKDKDSDVEYVDFVGAYDSEHNEGQWLRFIISYFGGHDRYLEVNYKAKKFVYFKINEGLSVDNLILTEDLKKCLAGYEQDSYDKWWKK